MPTFEVTAPNGAVYEIDTPEGATEQDAIAYLAAQMGSSGAAGEDILQEKLAGVEPDFSLGELGSRGLSRGFSRLGSTVTDILPALGGAAFGFDDYAREQLAEAAAKEAELQRTNPAQYQSFRDVEGITDVPGFIMETLGEQAANILPSLAGGVGLGALGARSAATAATRGIVEKEARDAALKQAAAQIAQGQGRGQLAGAAVGSYALNAPEVFQNIYEETGELAPGAAAAFSMAAAALDSILPAQLARSLTGPMKVGVAEALLARTGMDRGMLRKMAAGVLGGAATEAPTEAAQEAISIAAERFVADNPEAFTAAEIERLKESFVRGAVAGGGLSAVGAVPEGVRESAAVAQEKAAAPVVEDDLAPPPEGAAPTPPTPPATPPTPTAVEPESVIPEPTVRAQPAAPTPASPRMQEILRRMGYNEELVSAFNAAQATAIIEQRNPEMLDYLDESVALPEETVRAAPTQPAPKPAGPTPQEELDALKAEVARSEAEGAAREAAAEPTVAQDELTQEPTPQATPDTLIPADAAALKAWGRDNLGVGSTANLLKEGHPDFIGGKDLADPEQAAQVRAAIDKYKKGRSPDIQAKITAFLSRPELAVDTGPVGPVPRAELPKGPQLRKLPTAVVERANQLSGSQPPIQPRKDYTPEQAAATFFRAYDPDSAVRNMVAESMPEYTEEFTATTVPEGRRQAVAQTALRWVVENGGPDTARAVQAYTKEFQAIRDRAAIELEERAVKQERDKAADEAQALGRAEKVEQETTKKVDAALRKQEAATPTAGKKLDPATRAALKEVDKRVAQETEALEADTAVGRSTPPPEKAEASRKVAGQTKMFELTGGKVEELPYAGPETVRWGKYYLENASNSPKLEGDLLAAVQAGNLKKTISLLLGKTTKRPEVQQILRRIQSLGLKTKIVVGAVPEDGLANVVSITSRLDERALQQETAEGKGLFEAAEYSRVADEIAKLKGRQSDVNQMLAQSRLVELLRGMPGADRIDFSMPAEGRYAYQDALRQLQDITSLLDAAAEEENFFGSQLPRANDLIARHTTQIVEAFSAYISAARALRAELNPRSPRDRALANSIDAILGDNRVVPLFGEARAGSYDPTTDTITLDPELGLNEHTLIHELGHAALAERIADPKSKEAKAFGEFFQIVKNQLGGAYGGTDVQEFAAELLGSEQFAVSTKAIKAPKGGTLWDRIVQTLAEFFGFRKGQSVYDAGIKYINDLLNVPASAEPTLTEKLFMGTPNVAAKATAELLTAAIEAPKATLRDAQEMVDRATKEGGAAHTAFGFLNLQNMHDMFATGDAADKAFAKLPKAVQRLVLQRLGFINNESARISEERAKFPTYEANTALMERTHDIMFKAREGGVDLAPGGEKKIKTAEQRALHKELSQQLNALPKAYREMAYTMRKDYDNVYDAFQEAIASLFASDPKKAAEMKARFSTEMRIAGYIPSTRFGNLQVYFTDPVTGKEAMESFEYISDKEAFIKAAGLKPGEYYEKRKDENLSRMGNRVPPSAFVKELTDTLQAGGATDEMLGNVRELYLTMFPASSLAKNFIKSRNVPGMSKDMPRVHADFMLRATKQLADLKYAPDINDLMTQAENIAQDASNSPLLRAAARNLYEQRGFLNNPTYNGLVNGLSTASYVMNLVGNISAAAVNGSSLPLITFPILSARYNAGAVVKEMGAAMKLAAGKWGEGKYKALYDFINAHGQLTHTMHRELVEASRTKTGDSKTLFAKIIHLGSIPFVFVEQYARATTAIAAYELALNTPDIRGKKMNEKQALEYALDTVIRSNTAGTAAASPRYMQTEWGRVILTFKSFNLNGSFVAARGLWEAIRSEDDKVKQAAIRQSVAMFSAAGAFGGIMGLPFMGMAASFADIMAGLINMVDEDDEDYFSAQMFIRENTGRFLSYGPIDFLTGAAIGRRTVLTQDLVMRDDPKTIEEQGIVAALFKQMLGPMGAYAIDMPSALGSIKDGQYARGAEQLLPSAMRNVVKGWRYMSEGGVLTKNGDVITSDVTGFTVAKQILGFSPSTLADLYDRRNEAMQFTTQISERKQRLLAVIRAARRSGDLETSREAERKLQELGRKHPGLVNSDTVQRSIRASEAAMRDSITGLRFPTWSQPEVRRRFFQDEEN